LKGSKVLLERAALPEPGEGRYYLADLVGLEVVNEQGEALGVVKRLFTSGALEAGLWSMTTWNPRDFTTDNYRTVDDRPYGGGPGMVMLAEPIERTLNAVKTAGGGRVFYLSP